MTYLLIVVEIPNPLDLAEELGQRLLGRQIVKSGFPLTTYGSLATLEFPDTPKELVDKVESEVTSWIGDKHRSLRMRRLPGKRQRQNLGMPTEAEEEIVCLEIRK